MRDQPQAEAIRRRARVLLELGRPSEALAEVRRALAINPLDHEALEIEGLCQLRRGDFAAAVEVLRRAIAESPDQPHPHYLHGFALRELGRPRDAEEPLRTALELAPDEPVYLRAVAELCADLGRHPEALEAARRATEVAPDRAANHVTYGYVASAAGDKTLARVEYELAVAIDPHDSAAWNNLGCLDLEAGQPLRARLRFREALRLDPLGERAKRNLAMVLPAYRKQRGPEPRSWQSAVEDLARELVHAGAKKILIAALVLEAPEAARALVRGGRTGATVSGLATLMALRALGPVGLALVGVGAAAAGAAFLAGRQPLERARVEVRRRLAEGRAELDELWREWLAGALSRDGRDAAVDLLVEKMAAQLVEGECP